MKVHRYCLSYRNSLNSICIVVVRRVPDSVGVGSAVVKGDYGMIARAL